MKRSEKPELQEFLDDIKRRYPEDVHQYLVQKIDAIDELTAVKMLEILEEARKASPEWRKRQEMIQRMVKVNIG